MVVLRTPYVGLPIPVTIYLADIGLIIQILYELIKLRQCCHFCLYP